VIEEVSVGEEVAAVEDLAAEIVEGLAAEIVADHQEDSEVAEAVEEEVDSVVAIVADHLEDSVVDEEEHLEAGGLEDVEEEEVAELE
jgi:DNA-binding FrmR family transcriptional regulator